MTIEQPEEAVDTAVSLPTLVGQTDPQTRPMSTTSHTRSRLTSAS